MLLKLQETVSKGFIREFCENGDVQINAHRQITEHRSVRKEIEKKALVYYKYFLIN